MMLSVDDISSKSFKKRMGGYKSCDVDNLLKDIKTAYKNIQQENYSMLREIKELKDELFKYKETEILIRDTMINAQKSADLSIKKANYEADMILKEAKEKADSLIIKTKYEARDQEKFLQDLKEKNAKFRSKLLESYKEHIQLIGAFPDNKKENTSKEASTAEISEAPIKITNIETEHEKNIKTDKSVVDAEAQKESICKKYTVKSLDKFSDLKFGSGALEV